MTRRAASAAWIVLVGMICSGGVAFILGSSLSDTVVLVCVSAAGAGACGALGWLAVRSLRNRSLRVQVTVAALVALAATGAGAVAAAEAMFLSSHDLGVLLIVLVAAAAVALAAASACATTIAETASSLAALARRIGPAEPARSAEPVAKPDASHSGAHPVAGRAPRTGALSSVTAELEEVSRRLAESRREAQALERSRRELVAAVSHDLRAPLAAVRAMTEALADGVIEEPVTIDSYHAAIGTEVARLSKLVDELFELSRITSLAQRPDPDHAELGELVDFACAAGSARGAECEVVVRSRVDDPDVARASVPARDVARILANLIDNAVRHSCSGSAVTVFVQREGRVARVAVQDVCGGIPAAELTRVFDTAYRGDRARRGSNGGGLGLPIARGLAEMLGGTLTVANRGGGCCFELRLPAPASEEHAEAPAPHRAPAPSLDS